MDNQLSEEFLKTFVETSAYDQIRLLIDFGTQMPSGTVISVRGNPGYGKTHALLKLVSEHPRASYVEINQASKNKNGLARSIIRSRGRVPQGRNYFDLREECDWVLGPVTRGGALDPDQPSLLVIDEVQALEITTLRELLDIQQKSKCVLVICGNHGRLAQAKTDLDSKALLDQIETRISWRLMIEEPTSEDFELIAKRHGLERSDELAFCQSIGQATNLRTLSKVLQNAHMANPDNLCLATLKRIAPLTLGYNSPALKAVGLLT